MNWSSPPRELRHPRFYRLTAPLPLTVHFRSVIYRIEHHKLSGGGDTWSIVAASLCRTCYWELVRAASYREHSLIRAYVIGFDLLYPTGPATILERLCAEGRAERVRAGLDREFWRFFQYEESYSISPPRPRLSAPPSLPP